MEEHELEEPQRTCERVGFFYALGKGPSHSIHYSSVRIVLVPTIIVGLSVQFVEIRIKLLKKGY